MFAEIVQVAQIVSSVGALVAVGCSIYIANMARKEVREDRRLRTHPVVIMNPGGYGVSVTRKEFGHRIPGKDPVAVEADFKDLARGGLRIDSKPLGKMRNIGQGPAVGVEVTFTPKLIKIGDEEFNLDARKLAQPRYAPGWNTEVAMDHVLGPGAESEIAGLPCFVTLDFDERISYAEGLIQIKYADLSTRTHRTIQEFRYLNSGPGSDCRYLVTFGRILEIP